MTDESLPLGALYPGMFTPRLDVLDYKLRGQRGEPFKESKDHWTLRALPYNVDAAYWAMYDLLVALSATGREYHSRVGQNVVRMLTPGESRKIYFAIDDFMVRGRRAQNALAKCVRLVFPGASLPRSMSDLVKGLRKGKYEVPLGLQRLLVDYWATHGVQIKRYRDIGEHYALIWSYVTVTAPEGKPLVSVRLPSPEPASNPHRVRFWRPEIQAQPFVIEQFEALVEVVNRVVNGLIARLPGPDGRDFGYTGGRPIGGEQGYPGMSPDEVVRFARQLIGRMRGLPSGEWPEPEKP